MIGMIKIWAKWKYLDSSSQELHVGGEEEKSFKKSSFFHYKMVNYAFSI